MSALLAKVEKSGRILIPASIRKRLKMEAGAEVLLRVSGATLQVKTREQALNRIQRELRKYIPEGRVLSEELIAERREEAERENGRPASTPNRR